MDFKKPSDHSPIYPLSSVDILSLSILRFLRPFLPTGHSFLTFLGRFWTGSSSILMSSWSCNSISSPSSAVGSGEVSRVGGFFSGVGERPALITSASSGRRGGKSYSEKVAWLLTVTPEHSNLAFRAALNSFLLHDRFAVFLLVRDNPPITGTRRSFWDAMARPVLGWLDRFFFVVI